MRGRRRPVAVVAAVARADAGAYRYKSSLCCWLCATHATEHKSILGRIRRWRPQIKSVAARTINVHAGIWIRSGEHEALPR